MNHSLFETLTKQFSRSIGIDIGSFSTRLWGNGEFTTTASCLAIDRKTQRVLAAGEEAAAMEGRVGKQIEVIRPFERGVVTDVEAAIALCRVLFQQSLPTKLVINTNMMASVPASATQAEQETVSRMLYDLGGQEVYTIAQPLAAAIGAGVPVADASGSFIMHMGHSGVECAVISLGSMVAYEQIDIGGQHILSVLKVLIKKQYGLFISQETALDLLRNMLSAIPEKRTKKLVTGQDVAQGSPKEIEIMSTDLYPIVQTALLRYEAVLQRLLSSVPPELTVDVIDKGLLLSGGLAQLDGLEQYLTQQMGIPVALVDEPTQVVVKGIATALEHIELFKESLGYQMRE